MKPRGVHLVGSVPLADRAAVFGCVCEHLGEHIKRLPDGETGTRTNWIAWQGAVFEGMDTLVAEEAAQGYIRRPRFRIRPGVDPTSIAFPPLGYAREALASYAEFARGKADGRIPAHMKFLVCLPTPLAPLHSYVAAESMAALEAPYERALLAELSAIVAAIPARELAIQWDTAIEFAILEGVMPTFYASPEEDILARLVRWGDAVPAAVEMGFHLCYGDSGHRHFKEPDDTGKLVMVANHLATKLARRLDWLHLPVPRARDDDAYYAPLAGLHLASETELYLGLVHRTDGATGTTRRIAAASRVVPRFGIAAECGLGRRDPATIAAFLALHAALADPRA
ncbi:MAG: hypothetical protein JNM79_23385 [Burkholderiales bacterium]|nr:hypothetical protein [Burkholderiales bacterium]